MPVTAAGVAYTTQTIDLGAPHGVMHITVADAHRNDTEIPTILYAHGAGGASDQFVTLPAWVGLRDWLINRGWAILEGSGGAAVGDQNWGNLAAREALPAWVVRARLEISIGIIVLLGRSMGGLVTAWLYANDTTGQYAGWINNSGVSTMFVGASPYDAEWVEADGSSAAHWDEPPSPVRATAYHFAEKLWLAYGITVPNPSSVPSKRSAWDQMQAVDATAPETWPAEVWAGKNILCCYGDADTTVPWTIRGAGPLRDIWAGQPAIDRVAMKSGGDHSGTGGSYLQLDDMTNFLLALQGEEPPQPPDPVVYRTGASWLIGSDGRRYPMSSELL